MQLVRRELQISCSNQLSYAGAALDESRFNAFIKSSPDDGGPPRLAVC